MSGVLGHATNLYIRPETTYATLATGNYTRLGFTRAELGATRQLETLTILGLGTGRDVSDPYRGALQTECSVEVPVNQEGFGHWLRLLFGPPTTTGTAPNFVHVFNSGSLNLPSISLSLDYSSTLANRYLVMTGVRGGTLSISFGPTSEGEAPVTASIGLMGATSAYQSSPVHGTATTVAGANFHRAMGRILRGTQEVALVTEASLEFSNNLNDLRTIRSDARIEQAEPQQTTVSGRVTARLTENGLWADALSNTPVDITLGFEENANRSLMFRIQRAFLSLPRAQVEGPGGVSVTYDFIGAATSGIVSLAVTLRNGVSSYA